MVIVMDMSTGKRAAGAAAGADELAQQEFGVFAEEVMNAEWLPQPLPRLEPRVAEKASSRPVPPAGIDLDADAFLDAIYRHQE